MLDTIFSRRSIRRYRPDQISESDLRTILRAGCYAPSAMNCQPWHFVVIEDRAVLDQIMQVHPYAKMFSTAPYAIVVCGDI